MIYSTYLFLTELIPSAFLVNSMLSRLMVYSKARRHLDSINTKSKSSSSFTEKSLLNCDIDDLSYTTDVEQLLRNGGSMPSFKRQISRSVNEFTLDENDPRNEAYSMPLARSRSHLL